MLCDERWCVLEYVDGLVKSWSEEGSSGEAEEHDVKKKAC